MPCLWADSKTLFSTSDENDIIGSQTEYKMFCQAQITTKHKKKFFCFFQVIASEIWLIGVQRFHTIQCIALTNYSVTE